MTNSRSTAIAEIEDLSANLHDDKGALLLLSKMRAFEAKYQNIHTFKSPYYFWQWKLPDAAKDRILTWVKNTLEGTSEQSEFLYEMLVLARRIDTRLLCPLDDIIDYISQHSAIQQHIPLLVDIAALAQMEKSFTALTLISKIGLRAADTGSDEAHRFCDYIFQAAYQNLKLDIFRKRLTEEQHQSLQALRDHLGRYVPKNARNLALYDSIIASTAGDLTSAVSFAADARSRSGKVSPYFQAALNTVDMHILQQFNTDVPADTLPWLKRFPVTHHIRHKAEKVVLVSCDKGYFNQYARNFLASFSAANKGHTVHIHCVGFTPDFSLLDIWEQDLSVTINISVDDTVFESAANNLSDMKIGYYAGARYLHLPRYQQIYDKIIVSDIDGIFNNSINILFAKEPAIQLSSVVLDPDYTRYFAIWENIGAGAFACTSNQDHRRFTATLSGYLAARFEEAKSGETRFFYSDQIGLLQTYLMHKSACVFRRMPPTFEQSDSIKGTGRNQAKKTFQQEFLKKHGIPT